MNNLELGLAVSKCTIKDFIDTLANFADEDFNGNNGAEFTSEFNLQQGYNSDLEATLDYLHRNYDDKRFDDETLYNIMKEYVEDAFASSYYTDIEWTFERVQDNIVIAIACNTD